MPEPAEQGEREDEYDLSEEDETELVKALDESLADEEAGRLIPHDEVMRRLRAGIGPRGR